MSDAQHRRSAPGLQARGAAPDPRPVLFVTTEIPPDRVGAFRALAERVPVEFALFGGGLHATAGVDDHGLLARQVAQRDVYALAASGDYRAVVAGTVGRIALPAAWLGAERARVPFVLWSALWAHPRSLAHLPGTALLRILYRRAAVVVTYGPHVSAVAERHGARRTIVAPQPVDVAFWQRPEQPAAVPDAPVAGGATMLYVGRDDPGKGVDWLLDAWDASGLGTSPTPAGPRASLRLLGPDPARAVGHPGVTALGMCEPAVVRDGLWDATAVVVPSERTGTFREPWGLVVNEAMLGGALVIASTQVGAVAGGLAEPDRTALVVPAGDRAALAAALQTVADPLSPELRAIRDAASRRAQTYTYEAWADGFAGALDLSVAFPR